MPQDSNDNFELTSPKADAHASPDAQDARAQHASQAQPTGDVHHEVSADDAPLFDAQLDDGQDDDQNDARYETQDQPTPAQSDHKTPAPSRGLLQSAWPRRRNRVHPRQAWGPPWLTPISHRTQIDTFWLMIAMLMLALGVIFFGWRAMLSVSAAWLATLATYLAAAMLIQIFRPKRLPDSSLHVLTMGLLLGVSLPVMRDPWIPIGAGVLLGLLCHGIGRSHRVRIHPVAVALVLVWVIPNIVGQHTQWRLGHRPMITEPAVLQLDRLVLGDLYDTSRENLPLATWWEDVSYGKYDAARKPEPMQVLLDKNNDIPQHPHRLANLLSQSKLPRVEELLIGCVPGPIGATSKAVIIVIGLLLMYRRISWWTMAAAGMAAAVVMLFMLPVYANDHWTLMAVQLWDMGPALAFVYIGYFILACPLLWILLILAPCTAPMSSRGKIYYGLIIGAGTILAIWYTGNWSGGYIALLLASIFSRPLDTLQQSPMLSAR